MPAAHGRRRARGPRSTRDGVRVRLEANVELPDDVAVARREGAEGIGLFRSEFLLGGGPLDQAAKSEQYEAYRGVSRTWRRSR